MSRCQSIKMGSLNAEDVKGAEGPVDRFGIDLKQISFLPPDQLNDELFFAEDERKVKKDNTFTFNNIRYEAPADMREKTATIRFDRSKAGWTD